MNKNYKIRTSSKKGENVIACRYSVYILMEERSSLIALKYTINDNGLLKIRLA